MALAVALLLVAMLFGRSLQEGLRADVGFDPDSVVAATINLGAPLDYDRERGLAFHRELMERLGALPGVEQVGLARYTPLSWMSSGGGVRRPEAADGQVVYARMNSVSPSFFETMGIEVVAGRDFDESDTTEGPPVVIVSETLAERLWPGESPIGKPLAGVIASTEPARVVGVVSRGHYLSMTDDDMPYVFQPFGRPYYTSMAVHVRAPGAEAATLRALADEVRAIDPDVAVSMPLRVSDLVRTGLFPQRIAAQLVGAFGAIGFVLAVLGIFGALAYQAGRRTREMGVRRALGATSGQVVWLIVRGGLLVAGLGCALGVIAGAGLSQVVRSFLFGIRPVDPLTFVSVPLLMCAGALGASVLPARRASAVEAHQVMRSD